MNEEIASLNGVPNSESMPMITETGMKQDDEETWLYPKQKPDENQENGNVSSMDEPGTQEVETEEPSTLGSYPLQTMVSTCEERFDDDSDDDDIQVTIRPDLPKLSNQVHGRPLPHVVQPVAPKPQPRVVDIDGQGTINGQATMDFDIANALKDDEKPWKKPGADISDYFNYGFTEETWTQYCDRQRRLRNENNIARMNPAPMPPIPTMMTNHLPMMHPINPIPMMMMNKPPANLQMMTRPHMNVRKPDGKIDVIGATDQTSRRTMYDPGNNFDHQPYMNPPGFPGGQPPNSQTVGDLVTPSAGQNVPPTGHGTPPGPNHPIPTLGAHRLPNMVPPGPGLPFRPQFGHPHMAGGAPFFQHGPVGPMHGERPPQPYFVPHHPQQAWDKPGAPPLNAFNPGTFPPVPTVNNSGNGRPGVTRSPTPEDHSSRSSTPEENRPIGSIGDADKSSKDGRYKDRYRDDHPSLSRRRSSPKDHSSSMFRSRRRSGDHEYERPRNDRKTSRDREDKYERYPRKRHHRDEGGRHHRSGDDDSSRSHRSSRRTPSKNFSSPPKSLNMNNNTSGTGEPSLTGPGENLGGIENEPSTGPSASSPNSRSRREDSERSSSRHSHHKKSSKRSRRDSGDERSGSRHHHRRSKDKSSNSKKSSTSTAPDPPSESKDQINE